MVWTRGQHRARIPAPTPGSGWRSGRSRGGCDERGSQQPARLLEDRLTIWPQPHESTGSDEPAVSASPLPDALGPMPETEADQEVDDLGIKDAVIRELARALQPRGRG
jgi:hypothetical protein